MSEVDTSDGWAAYIEYPFISSIFERLKDSTELLLLLQSNALAPASFRFSFRHSTAFRCDVMVKSTWKNPRGGSGNTKVLNLDKQAWLKDYPEHERPSRAVLAMLDVSQGFIDKHGVDKALKSTRLGITPEILDLADENDIDYSLAGSLTGAATND